MSQSIRATARLSSRYANGFARQLRGPIAKGAKALRDSEKGVNGVEGVSSSPGVEGLKLPGLRLLDGAVQGKPSSGFFMNRSGINLKGSGKYSGL